MPVNARPVAVLGLAPGLPILWSCAVAVRNEVPGRGAVASRFVSNSSSSKKGHDAQVEKKNTNL